MLDYVALGVIFFLLVLITAGIVFIGSIPGKIAKKRGHPWPDAVNAASWIGLATGVFWPVAFIWAYLPIPERRDSAGADLPSDGELKHRVAALEAQIENLQSQAKESTT